MGSMKLDIPSNGKVYVDANLIIYRVEQIEPYLSACASMWEAAEQGRIHMFTSDLTLLEVSVKPIRDGNNFLASLYRTMFDNAIEISSIAITKDILEIAGALRAKHGLKSPDAIHAATALHLNAASFITNDSGFRRVPNLPVLVVSECL